MKNFISSVKLVLVTFLLVGLSMNFGGCSNDSIFQPEVNENQSDDEMTLNKISPENPSYDIMENLPSSYPQYISCVVFYQAGQNAYLGGIMNVPGGSMFKLAGGSLIPPADISYGEDVILTMEVNKVKIKGNEVLEFTFGPHGSEFITPAEVTLDWTDLGIDIANLYYIDDNNNYIPQTPDQIDVKNKKITLYLSHFSRYALAHSR